MTPVFRPGARFQRDKVTGKAVILFPEGMLELNETGTSIVELLDGVRSIEAIAETLANRFNAPADVVLADVTEYFTRLRDRGLVEFK